MTAYEQVGRFVVNYAGEIVLVFVASTWAAYWIGKRIAEMRGEAAAKRIGMVMMQGASMGLARHVVDEHGLPLEECDAIRKFYESHIAIEMATDVGEIIKQQEGGT